MSLEIRTLSQMDCERATASSYSDDIIEILAQALRCAPTARPEDPILFLASIDGKMAGRMMITYGHISDNGQVLRVAAAQDHYTDPQFRGQGIGTKLIKKCLDLPLPCMWGGISGQARPLYDHLGFSFIDESPMYRLPLNAAGILHEWRNELYSVAPNRPEKKTASGAMRTVWASQKKALHSPTDAWRPIEYTKALLIAKRLAELRYRRFQVPWNLELISSELKGERPQHNAVVLRCEEKPGAERLITVKRRTADARFPMTRLRLPFADGHVNEIYPPIDDKSDALGIIKALSVQAKQWSYGNLSIYGMTAAVREACADIGLFPRGAKSVAIMPMGLDEQLAAAIRDPGNWWCRALNENDLEEAARVK